MSKKDEVKPVKMVIVVRADTQPPMRKGKVGSQCVHAGLTFFRERINEARMQLPELYIKYGDFDFWGFLGIDMRVRQWLDDPARRVIVLKAETEAVLTDVHMAAREAGLESNLIIDAGKTEFAGPTKTCVAIGPDYDENIDPITGNLKPY